MVVMKLSILLAAVLLSVDAQSEDLCLPLRRDSGIPQQTEVTQGRAGKRGPIGSPGVKGDHGPPGPQGQCNCDLYGGDQLRQQVRDLQEHVQLLRLVHKNDVNLALHCLVGVKSGEVEDAYMTASSKYSSRDVATEGRLDKVAVGRQSAAWVPASNRQRKGEWLQIELRSPVLVTGVITQGRRAHGRWVTSYKIKYGNSTTDLQYVTSSDGSPMLFQGNRDRNSYVLNRFPNPVVARYLRLVVITWNQMISLRLDYTTC